MISITITADNVAQVIGSMEDFLNGGNAEISAPDFETSDPPAPRPFPVGKRRGRKPKAAATAAGDPQAAAAAILPAPLRAPAPAAAAPSAPAPATAGPAATSPPTPPAGVPLDASAVAPGGAVFLAVKAFNDKHGMEKARALLLEFGCGMVRQIKPEQYAAVIAKCAAA